VQEGVLDSAGEEGVCQSMGGCFFREGEWGGGGKDELGYVPVS
jgi:hypothetical protein